ncbi:MAG: TniQ family protein [Lachnospiraceae bacterium]|nr:TniQ family protein [Lachnospiraceae bacterium]MDD7628993.1 TniQ family protein [Lachnospiraceae bacterium]MDY4117667.1 hypothetical protein [Lachnospiraceae bacterium]
MLPITLPIQKNELFYSWVIRVLQYNYPLGTNEAKKEWINKDKYCDSSHPQKTSYGLVENYHRFKEEAGFSDDEFIKLYVDKSLFKPLSMFMNDLQKKLYLLMALGELGRNEETVLERILKDDVEKLSYCPMCVEEGKTNNGYVSFYSGAQLPGVCCCHKHHVPLMVNVNGINHEFDYPINGKPIVDRVSEIDIEYAEFIHDLVDKGVCYKKDELVEFMKKMFGSLETVNSFLELDKLAKQKYPHLFITKPSYFFSRNNRNGTYLDAYIGLPLMFMLQKESGMHAIEELNQNTDDVSIDLDEMHQLLEKYGAALNNYYASSISRNNARTEEIFKHEIEELVGDEYSLCSGYVDSNTKVIMRHNVCNNVFEVKPIAFLDGCRCECKSRIYTISDFKHMVEGKTNGEFTITGYATSNLLIVQNVNTGLELAFSKRRILQEITKKTPSKLFPNRIDDYEYESNPSKYQIVLNYLKENYGPEDYIFLEDISIKNVEYSYLKNCLKALAEEGRIVKVYDGIYAHYEIHLDAFEVLKAKYINRNGKVIGTFYGKTLSEEMNLPFDEDNTVYIISNKETQTHGRKKTLFGIDYRVKGSQIIIDNKNCHAVSIVDFLLSYWKYTTADKESVLESAVEYAKENRITTSMIKKISEYYNFKQNGIFPIFLERLKE